MSEDKETKENKETRVEPEGGELLNQLSNLDSVTQGVLFEQMGQYLTPNDQKELSEVNHNFHDNHPFLPTTYEQLGLSDSEIKIPSHERSNIHQILTAYFKHCNFGTEPRPDQIAELLKDENLGGKLAVFCSKNWKMAHLVCKTPYLWKKLPPKEREELQQAITWQSSLAGGLGAAGLGLLGVGISGAMIFGFEQFWERVALPGLSAQVNGKLLNDPQLLQDVAWVLALVVVFFISTIMQASEKPETGKQGAPAGPTIAPIPFAWFTYLYDCFCFGWKHGHKVLNATNADKLVSYGMFAPSQGDGFAARMLPICMLAQKYQQNMEAKPEAMLPAASFWSSAPTPPVDDRGEGIEFAFRDPNRDANGGEQAPLLVPCQS